jgi:hypothetical protein
MSLSEKLIRREGGSESGHSGLPLSYGGDLEPSAGGAIYGAPPGSASAHAELGFGPGAAESQHAVRAAPLEYSHGAGAEFALGYAVGPRVGAIYDGGGWPEHPSGSYRGPLPAARARSIRQELSSVDDYDQGTAVDDLGRGSPGRLRNVTRGEYGD